METPHTLLLQEANGIAVMLCEEDHLRIQSILSGLSLEECYKNASAIEKRLDADFDFAYSDSLGYLTHCPTNLGTGMRASVMMFLPALSRGGYIPSLASQLVKLGLAMRGIFGEGSGSAGCMYQISNQITLGVSENEILTKLNDAVREISESEMQARKNIQEDALESLTDRVGRSVGILKHAYMMSTEEFIKLFCEVRLGISKGLAEGICYEQLGTLLVEAMPATLTLSTESTPKGEAARDKLRAARIKAVLERLGLPVEVPVSMAKLVKAMAKDKKSAGEKIHLVVPREIGRCEVVTVEKSQLSLWYE
jgi:protein arginine kinase